MSYRSTNAFLAELPDLFRTDATSGNGLVEYRSYGQCDVELYHEARTHQALNNDCPVPRPVEPRDTGEVVSAPVLGGLHHRYWRTAA